MPEEDKQRFQSSKKCSICAKLFNVGWCKSKCLFQMNKKNTWLL